MRVLTCIVLEHDLRIIVLAAVMCILGSSVTIDLFRRTMATEGVPRLGWLFLGAVSAGATIWSTHFIAMLGYRSAAPSTFDPVLTIVSALIAVGGAGIAFLVAGYMRSRAGGLLGGGLLGLAISAMHYTGMFAHRIDGIVSWDSRYIVASLLLASGLSMVAMTLLKPMNSGRKRYVPALVLSAAIVSLHFTGMAAFQVTPLEGVGAGMDPNAMRAMALAILFVGLLVVGTGLSSYLIDDRMRALSLRQLERMAFLDPLTALANRHALSLHLAERESGEAGSQELLLLDLDHFKRINDTFGHATGDELLVQVARRLEAATGPGCFVSRIGGDEFAIVRAEEGAPFELLAAAIVSSIERPFSIGGRELVISCSIGACPFRVGESVETMMQQADIALYEAKRLGRGRAFRYEEGMLERVAARNALEGDLKRAIEEGQFHLEYQRIVDIGSNRAIGYEALIRWTHPERGLISPAEFIPLAEENGMIDPIGAWVLRTACRDAAGWSDELTVAVNVSAMQLRSAALLSCVTNALAESGLPAHRLEIELTETAMVTDGPLVAHMLGALRKLGVRIAMDDFGTGFSSLAHLRDLPLDRIKIDRSFVASARTDPNSLAVLKAITQLGRDMRIHTLGEGVEDDDQLRMLSDLGCNAVQGFLMGRPQRLDRWGNAMVRSLATTSPVAAVA